MEDIDKSSDYEFPLIPKNLLFAFEFKENNTIIFEKNWMRLCNSMFWSSPKKMELPKKNIIAIALKNNPSFQTFLDLYLLFGEELILQVYEISNIENFEKVKKYTPFYELCMDIFRNGLKNYKKIDDNKIPIAQEDFIKLIYSKLYEVDINRLRGGYLIQLLYEKAVLEEKKLIQEEIKEYILDCFLADFKSLHKE